MVAAMADDGRVRRVRAGACGAVLALVVLLVSACDPNTMPDPPALVRASVGSISVTGRPAGSAVTLSGPVQRTAQADAQGAVIFRGLPAGPGYAVRADGLDQTGITVLALASSTPSASFYAAQQLRAGFQYLKVRDGTTLSALVYLPPGPGPFPTVVEFSADDESRPLRNFELDLARDGIPPEYGCAIGRYLCGSSPYGKGLYAAMADHAVVNVNVRGTGCSGGGFELLTDQFRADGYDVVEAVAAQPWVKGHRVGMVGSGFAGFSQIPVASTHPPSLAAIAPEMPAKDLLRDVAAPGGVANTGFDRAWAESVDAGAAPYGQGWEQQRMDRGDEVCARNQVLHGQRERVLPRPDAERYHPDDVPQLDLTTAAASVDVPVFLTTAWQDEQFGSGAAGLCDRFVRAPVRRCVLGNGFQGDENPDTLVAWKAFLDFYVGRERRPIAAPAWIAYSMVTRWTTGESVGFTGPEPFLPDAGGGVASGFDALRRRYEASPGVELLLDVGAAGRDRALSAGATAQYASWPPPGVQVDRYALGAGGTLRERTGPASVGTDTAVRFRSSNALAAQRLTEVPAPPDSTTYIPTLAWERERAGEAAVFLTAPATADRLLAGPSRADLWIRSSAAGADLAVTVSEVAPDGTERLVQSGVARAELAVPGPGATALDSASTGRRSSARPVQPGVWQQASIRVLPFAHLLRAGSRLKVSIHTPGGDHLVWAFRPDPQLAGAEPTIDIGTGGRHPSSISIGWVPAPVSRPLPRCGVVRAQACRPYVPYANTPST